MSLPALLEALNECLVDRCILGNGLDDAPFNRHMANSPLAHSCAAQAEDIAGREGSQISHLDIILFWSAGSVADTFTLIHFFLYF